MSNCLTCVHNTYSKITAEWVSCGHSQTIAKTPRPNPGDPAWVNFMTADMRTEHMLLMFASNGDCATYEATP